MKYKRLREFRYFFKKVLQKDDYKRIVKPIRAIALTEKILEDQNNDN